MGKEEGNKASYQLLLLKFCLTISSQEAASRNPCLKVWHLTRTWIWGVAEKLPRLDLWLSPLAAQTPGHQAHCTPRVHTGLWGQTEGHELPPGFLHLAKENKRLKAKRRPRKVWDQLNRTEHQVTEDTEVATVLKNFASGSLVKSSLWPSWSLRLEAELGWGRGIKPHNRWALRQSC